MSLDLMDYSSEYTDIVDVFPKEVTKYYEQKMVLINCHANTIFVVVDPSLLQQTPAVWIPNFPTEAHIQSPPSFLEAQPAVHLEIKICLDKP